MKDTSNSDLTIKVTGYQWKWGYDYLRGEGEGIAFLSQLATPAAQIEGREPKSNTYLLEVDNPLVVPVNKKVRIITTASDVIHAWWVPAFAVKQDAIPGFARDTWFRAEQIGTFRGQCAELCGKDHGFMPIVVKAVSKAEFAQWAAEQRAKNAPPAPAAPAAPVEAPATEAAPAAEAAAPVTAAAEQNAPAAAAKSAG
jgi:cytochrome c oxidase subunit 2